MALWRDTVAPWFNEVWPTRSQDKSAKLSEKLACMAIESNEAFPRVVDVILEILVQEEFDIIPHRLLEKEKETQLISTFPKHTLMLVEKLNHPRSNRDNLREILETTLRADPQITNFTCYKRLARKLDIEI